MMTMKIYCLRGIWRGEDEEDGGDEEELVRQSTRGIQLKDMGARDR